MKRLFATRETLVFLDIVEVHVIAHVTFAGLLQRLVIPRVIPALAQRLVNNPPARLSLLRTVSMMMSKRTLALILVNLSMY